MNFLNPLALLGLIALAVPIILLLFFNRRRLILPWAAYEWMRQAVVRHQKRIVVTDLLKLISKLLLLAAMVMMIARPFFRNKSTGGDVLLIVDVSPSMGAAYENKTRLEKARELARDFVARHDGRMAVYAFSDSLSPVVADFSGDKAVLNNRIRAIELRQEFGGLSTLSEKFPLVPPFGRANRVVFIGDFQNCWYGDGRKAVETVRKFGKGHPMTWIQVDERDKIPNCSVAAVKLSPEGALAGRAAFLSAEVVNFSELPSPERVLTVRLNDKEALRTVIKLGAREKKEIPIPMVFKEPGIYSIKVELDTDAVEADNARYAAVDVPPPLRVLVAAPGQGKDPFPYDIYVRSALRTLLPPEGLTCKTLTPAELETQDLENADVIVLIKSPLLNGGGLWQKLEPFLERGGGLIAFLPAERPDEASALGFPCAASEDPGRYTRQTIRGTYIEFMADPEIKPEAVNIKKSLLFSDVPDANVRLRTSAGVNGVCKAVGRGKAVAVGFVPYQGTTDFQFNPNFVQAFLRMLWEARGWQGFSSDNGVTKEWKAAGINPDHGYALADEKKSSQPLKLEGVGKDAKLLIPPDLPPGIYGIIEDGKEIARLGHNVDVADFSLEPVRKAALAEAEKEGLTFSTGIAVSRTFGRTDLVILTTLLLLMAAGLEVYAHFFRKIS